MDFSEYTLFCRFYFRIMIIKQNAMKSNMITKITQYFVLLIKVNTYFICNFLKVVCGLIGKLVFVWNAENRGDHEL
jgi:hypothetical protein